MFYENEIRNSFCPTSHCHYHYLSYNFFIVTLNSIKVTSEEFLVNSFKSLLAIQTINKSLEEINGFYTDPL